MAAPTDSVGPKLRPVTNGLGFVPYANGVHYDSEERRQPLLHELVGAGESPSAYATDDGAGLLCRGTQPAEGVAENDSAGVYFVEGGLVGVVEQPLMSGGCRDEHDRVSLRGR